MCGSVSREGAAGLGLDLTCATLYETTVSVQATLTGGDAGTTGFPESGTIRAEGTELEPEWTTYEAGTPDTAVAIGRFDEGWRLSLDWGRRDGETWTEIGVIAVAKAR